MHNGIKFEACRSGWGTASKASPTLWDLVHIPQNASVSSKTRIMPRIQNTRKSLYRFDWNNCSLLICTMISRKISTHNLPSFSPPTPPQFNPESKSAEPDGKPDQNTLRRQAQEPLETTGTDIAFNLFLLVRKHFNPVGTIQTWNHLINFVCLWSFQSFTQKRFAP